MPATVSEEDRVAAEKILVNLAVHASPVEVKKAGDRILDTLDPDGPEPKDPPERPERELSFQEHRDGSATLKGKLDNVAYAQLRAALDPLAKPHSTKEEGRDTRSQWERHADALVDLVRLAMTVDEIPTHGGDRVHVAVTVDYETLKSGIGTAMLDYGGVITAAEARMLACDCKVIPAVLGTESEQMDLGRSKRIITTGQRRRLVMRDRGCAFPGCKSHAKHCDGHHIVFWILGGPTDLDNLTLLCERHHRLIHCGGWEVRMGGDGRPDFIPPTYLDPLRRPRRNTLHV
ncbi:MAG: endonuclease, partial [Amycolatopsis sp.]|uniref:HNH endonuclease signature motif containing protein n=1 Tax=Amycolatopsis sp. TaxID=37632 RepID=UPI00260D6B6B